MRMRSLERRVHLLLDEPRYRKVSAEADRRHVSVASVIRDAIDGMPEAADQRRAAIAAVLAAEPMPVPSDPLDLRRELDAARERVG
jgi:hypothetical protein